MGDGGGFGRTGSGAVSGRLRLPRIRVMPRKIRRPSTKLKVNPKGNALFEVDSVWIIGPDGTELLIRWDPELKAVVADAMTTPSVPPSELLILPQSQHAVILRSKTLKGRTRDAVHR